MPLLGNALQIDPQALHRQLEGWAAEHGPIFALALGLDVNVCISDPADIDLVLRQRPRKFRRRQSLAQAIEELGVHGVFTAEASNWTKQRKLAMRALHPKNLKSFFPALLEVVDALVARWDAAADAGVEIDLQHDFMCFTVDVTTRLAFAQNVDALAGGASELLSHLDPLFPALARRLFAVVPYWRWFKLPRDRALEAHVAAVRTILEEMIAEARKEMTEAPRNFLEAMLEDTDGEGAFDDTALFGNAITMLLAGEDTTANSLSWAVHLLLDHPDAVERIRAEAKVTLGDQVRAETPEQASMVYVESVIHESMRLKPVGPIMFLESLEPCVLSGVAVPAGTHITVLNARNGLDAATFPSPARFDPDRWADRRRAAELQKVGKFTPFGSGPRICPGRSLALLEMQVVLPMLFHRYQVERVGRSDEVREVNGMTMAPNGLPVRLHPRAQAPQGQEAKAVEHAIRPSDVSADLSQANIALS